MKIAIVGGSGFIGTHTAVELKKHSHHVVIIDKRPPRLVGVEYIQADVTDYTQTVNALSSNFDAVYMFAAISDSAENINEPLHAVNNNILTLANVLHAMQHLKINKIIFSSTVWVYSVAKPTRVNEETPLHINESDHIYTTSKLTCESIIRNYSNMYDIKHTILRYGIAYGPGCHPDTILSRFITNALTGKALTITGNGNIYRNFLYVSDHARGNRLALSSECDNQTINLEGPEKITLTRVAETVQRMHDSDVTIQYTDQRVGDYKGKLVSNVKSKNLLKWKPTVTFEVGSKILYDYIKQQNIDSCASR